VLGACLVRGPDSRAAVRVRSRLARPAEAIAAAGGWRPGRVAEAAAPGRSPPARGPRLVPVSGRWFTKRALLLHFLLVTVVPGCLLAGWWQVTRALGGNLLSYFYSVEWPIFAILGVVAWWQLVHDQAVGGSFGKPDKVRRSFLHRDDELPSPALVWDSALETPDLTAYNAYLKALAAGRGRKTWGNPRGLPVATGGQGAVELEEVAAGSGGGTEAL